MDLRKLPASLTFVFCLLSVQLVHAQNSLPENTFNRYPMLEKCSIEGFREEVLCGTLEVFENRNTRQGKKIPIEVIVIPSTTDEPLASAFTRHVGGNGMSARNKIWSFMPGRAPEKIRELQDIVLIDDRGTGASLIQCAAIDSLQPSKYVLAYDETLIKKCLEEVRAKVNMALYNTPAVVEDYEEVRKWLGIPAFDFYGPSYGVRVGLEYIRQFPGSIRTMTFHGAVPPDYNYVNEMDGAIQHQLDQLITRCTADSACNSLYPDFNTELYAVRDRLREHPETTNYELDNGETYIIEFTDYLYRRIIAHQMLNGNALGTIPMLVHQAFNGNLAPLILTTGGLNLDMPVFLSQFCPEEIDRFTYRKDSIRTQQFFTQGAIAEEKVNACSWWMKMPAADWLDEPIESGPPVLLLTGEYDANTPVKMGDKVQKLFPENSRHIVMPHQGHASSGDSDCRYTLISAFIKTGQLSLDTSCLQSISPGAFAWEATLAEEDYLKYTGVYKSDNADEKLELFLQNGMHFMTDEFSGFSGPSLLLYKGNNKFQLLDCGNCTLNFDVENGAVISVDRKYREVSSFRPVDNE